MRLRTYLALAALALPASALAHIGGFRGGGGGFHYGGFSGGYRGVSAGGYRYGGYSGRSYSVPHYAAPNYTYRPSVAPRNTGYLPARPTTYNYFNNRSASFNNFNRSTTFNSWNRSTTINSTRIGGWNPTVVNRGWQRPSIGVNANRYTGITVNRGEFARPAIRPPVVANNRFTSVNVNNRVNAIAARNLVSTSRLYNRPWGRYYPWYHGGWYGWNYWPSFWGGWGVGVGTGFALGASDVGYTGPTIVYDNPYYVPVPVAPTIIQESNTYVVPQPFNYSQPIQVPTVTQFNQTDTDLATESKAKMATASASFQAGDYAAAMRECDEAVKLLPGDTNLHEFRALCQFAQKKYADAAGTLYAVLADGPGWDWKTLSSFYRDEDTYTRQLRALESFARANPKDAAAHFVLAYQYLVLNQRAAAADQLAEVVKLQPKDKVSAGLLDALRKDQAGDKDKSD